jgi:uncharacterized membrane protein
MATSIVNEIFQNEIENLKQTMADMEEKVQYQSDERLRDVHEVLENCQTRVKLFDSLFIIIFNDLTYFSDSKTRTFITTAIYC